MQTLMLHELALGSSVGLGGNAPVGVVIGFLVLVAMIAVVTVIKRMK